MPFILLLFAVSLFDQLMTKHNLSSAQREFLRSAAYLHECGLLLGIQGTISIPFILLRNSLPGFTTREMQIIATIVRYHRKRIPRKR